MKRIKDYIMKNKQICILVATFVIILTIVVWYATYNKDNIYEFIIGTVILGIVINIASSTILFYLLERKREKDRVVKIQAMINSVLANEVRQFLYFVFCMYMASLENIEQKKENIFEDINSLYSQLLKMNLNNKTILENTYKIITKKDNTQEKHITSKTWGQAFLTRIYQYREKMKYIRDTYNNILDIEIYVNITNLLYNYDNFNVKTQCDKIYINTGFAYNTDLTFRMAQFETTLYQTIELCKLIKQYYSIDIVEHMKFYMQGIALGVTIGERIIKVRETIRKHF